MADDTRIKHIPMTDEMQLRSGIIDDEMLFAQCVRRAGADDRVLLSFGRGDADGDWMSTTRLSMKQTIRLRDLLTRIIDSPNC